MTPSGLPLVLLKYFTERTREVSAWGLVPSLLSHWRYVTLIYKKTIKYLSLKVKNNKTTLRTGNNWFFGVSSPSKRKEESAFSFGLLLTLGIVFIPSTKPYNYLIMKSQQIDYINEKIHEHYLDIKKLLLDSNNYLSKAATQNVLFYINF